MDILLTFAGNRDPCNPEVVKGVFTDGPVLTLLAERSFTAIRRSLLIFPQVKVMLFIKLTTMWESGT